MERMLKGYRADAGLHQSEVAQKLGITQGQYSILERALDDAEMRDKLGALYGVKIDVKITKAG